MDIRLENEFKYRCIRLKRKKTGTVLASDCEILEAVMV